MKAQIIPQQFTAQQLRRALRIREQIEQLERELQLNFGRAKSVQGLRRPRRRMSLSLRRKIAAGQRARWAKKRAQGGNAASQPKRALSSARRAKLASAARARWAKAKAEGRTKL